MRDFNFWRRKISILILIAGIGLIVFHLYQKQPVKIEVSYHYGQAKNGLKSATMRYFQGKQQLRWIQFQYQKRKAVSIQKHSVNFPQGEYQVVIELVYREQIPPRLLGKKTLSKNNGSKVRLQRPLIVGKTERVSIFL